MAEFRVTLGPKSADLKSCNEMYYDVDYPMRWDRLMSSGTDRHLGGLALEGIYSSTIGAGKASSAYQEPCGNGVVPGRAWYIIATGTIQ